MAQTSLYPSWKEVIHFDAEAPQPQKLIETETFRAVLAGLEAGQKIPPHAAPASAYHFLEGEGWMIVDGQRLAVAAGATVVVADGATRAMEAETRLSFLGTQAA